ncbi:MAG: DUF3159 domain-containing protein [Candidatus Izemoplasmataceae bacterium]
MTKFKEIVEEFKTVVKGKTLDALLPPIIFIVFNSFLELIYAMIGAVLIAFVILIMRIIKKEKSIYALAGFLGVLFAVILTYINQNATSFYLPGLISSGLLTLIILISLLIKKPLALYASHLTRGWTFEWFFRKDIYPAYLEATIFWLIFFALRTSLLGYLYTNDEVELLFLINTLLGLPATFIVLLITYIYGLWRLRTLGGPGIEEFDQGKNPPYKGQTRGF